jgi:hypothetical protein
MLISFPFRLKNKKALLISSEQQKKKKKTLSLTHTKGHHRYRSMSEDEADPDHLEDSASYPSPFANNTPKW